MTKVVKQKEMFSRKSNFKEEKTAKDNEGKFPKRS